MAEDKRTTNREPVEIKVEYRTMGSFLSEWSDNLSRDGIFVQSSHPLKIGTQVRLVFSLPDIPLLFDLNGVVRWQRQAKDNKPNKPGMGIEFMQMDESTSKRIEIFLAQNQQESIADTGRSHED